MCIHFGICVVQVSALRGGGMAYQRRRQIAVASRPQHFCCLLLPHYPSAAAQKFAYMSVSSIPRKLFCLRCIPGSATAAASSSTVVLRVGVLLTCMMSVYPPLAASNRGVSPTLLRPSGFAREESSSLAARLCPHCAASCRGALSLSSTALPEYTSEFSVLNFS